MKTSDRLYGGLDRTTAQLQLALFKNKKAKAVTLMAQLRVNFDVGSFTPEQRELEFRIEDIKKAVIFCENQCLEALESLEH